MAKEDKIMRAISKINRLTQEGEIKWTKAEEAPKCLTTGTDDKILNFYLTSYENRNLGIYEERYQAWDGYSERFSWEQRIVLAIFDSDWKQREWEFPQKPGLYDLYRSVEYQVADVDSFLGSLLSDSEKNEANP